MAAELVAARPGRSLLPARAWDSNTDLAADLGADSLGLASAATGLADLLGFSRSGISDTLLSNTRLADWIATARVSLARDDALLTFRTSGSTGNPKRCSHSLANLWREVEELDRLLPGRRRIVTAVPAHHIYGFLFTVLLPQATQVAGTSLPVVDLRSASPAALAGSLAPGDLAVPIPTSGAQ